MKLKPITMKTLCALSLSLAMPAAFAGNITDIESKAAHNDQSCYKMSQTWENHVGNILTAFAGNTDDAPNIQLSTDIQND